MRHIKRGTAALVAVFALAGLAACGGSSSGGGGGGGGGNGAAAFKGPLIVGGWGSSYDQATMKYYAKPFAQSGGATIQFDDASGTQVAKLNAQARANHVTWDMIDSVAGADGYLLQKQGLLEPLPADLKSQFVKTLGAGKVSDFGFTMGNLSYAIVCNMKTMTTCPKNMAQFFDAKAFPQTRELPSAAPLEVLTMAEVANGVPASQTSKTPVNLDRAFAKLQGIRPKVKAFWESGDQSEQVIRTGEVDMGLIWSGRAYRLAKEPGQKLQINIDGGGYEPGYWTVTKGSQHKAAAFALMKWIATHPKAQAQWSKALSYSVPNPQALKYMPATDAHELPDYPPNFARLAVPDFQWYADNAQAVNSRWQDYVRG